MIFLKLYLLGVFIALSYVLFMCRIAGYPPTFRDWFFTCLFILGSWVSFIAIFIM